MGRQSARPGVTGSCLQRQEMLGLIAEAPVRLAALWPQPDKANVPKPALSAAAQREIAEAGRSINFQQIELLGKLNMPDGFGCRRQEDQIVAFLKTLTDD